MTRPDIGVIGAGAFGTALAIALAQAGKRVALWARDPAQAEAMARQRENAARLPGAPLPPRLTPTADLTQAAQAPILLLAVPTQTLRGVVRTHARDLTGRTLVACCKGVELGTGLLPTQVIAAVIPGAPAAVLTGPSFAADIALGKPTALTLALSGTGGETLQAALATHNLRLYLSDDPVGAQWAGALKNVIAIAAGLTIGAGLGESARAALMTRGMAEMARLATQRGARAETLWGLSGFGDLVLTCTSEKSRNFRHGLAIGQGAAPDPSQTVEGVMTAHAIAADADPDRLPVTCMVSALLKGAVSLDLAKDLLLSRPLRRERG
ncbi:MAG: NAD(P)-dependent glycerol-3-phosphate dehydrogenase [Rhodobacter sp.]|uniref:NAD(P)H-dependent glycerol-3-phosphate dehydrogenase n=1 Tax=Pararhodobacter sp. TaxID=2127056 RepID=UPI001DA69EBE|nr:NAD(P)H-dependent glycerol-3-phosphate dehydrogenase [Pararhodobacter sp.]MCB1345548.1 NAD(P)-dependent glycerol-3-phosphate dehydrogenase [Paracoccaceae bacterium]MCC0071801.1 NAD(P)-dependent glycerol-3-phosphate dehydrogenase [Rhodobacter sp.]HPD91090.1 NAD(P)H-dependent glycerol-3-phosphate dehydrogenase [Pararhodobacter sp.]